MGMSIEGLKKECRYCYREIDNSGLEGFRCTNKTVNKSTSWCLPKCADMPCSTCEFCEIKDDNECPFYETCRSRTAVCKVRQPDKGCPIYRYFEGLIVKNHETRLKADIVDMLIELQNKINAIPINPDNSEAFRLGQATAYDKSEDVIQQKIDKLKENNHESS